MNESIIEVVNLSVDYPADGENPAFRAVNNISLNVREGEIFAIAGESGCGKSTLAKTLIRLIKPTEGCILFQGKNIAKLTSKERKEFNPAVQMVFQNPYHSLNPKMKIFDILKESLDINTKLSKEEKRERIESVIRDVGLSVACLTNYPHEFSGGQRQRIAIARALILNPKVIIADEPVSALDASIQAQILNLLNELKQKYKLTIIFISHDLRVIRYLADRVAIMYLGELQELGTVEDIFCDSRHPYTKTLLEAIPDIGKAKAIVLDKENDVISDLGCKFAPRCTKCINDKCTSIPRLVQITDSHSVRCVLYKE